MSVHAVLAALLAASAFVLAGCGAQPSRGHLLACIEAPGGTEADDVRAFQACALAVDSDNAAASQAALDRLRASPRLQAAMELVLKDLQISTALRNDTRETFIPAYRRRSEVRTYVRLRGLAAAEEERYAQGVWEQTAVTLERVRAERLAEEKRLADEAAASKARDDAAMAALIADAARGSRVTCASDAECRKAFALAQIFVSTKTDMKIQLATDTIIETYNPTEAGKMGAKVIKTPGAGQSAEIVLTVTCRECTSALRKVSFELMAGFRSFVEVRLKQ